MKKIAKGNYSKKINGVEYIIRHRVVKASFSNNRHDVWQLLISTVTNNNLIINDILATFRTKYEVIEFLNNIID
jgi:hypothetical protein